MFVAATFEHGTSLELALTELEEKGIKKEKIFAIPLDKRRKPRKLFDSLHYSDGISLFDGGAALGTTLMLFGVIYGFRWKWGPIIWGLIGLFLGFAIGTVVDYFWREEKSKGQEGNKNKYSEVIVMVQCTEMEFEMVERTLWQNQAFGVAKVDR